MRAQEADMGDTNRFSKKCNDEMFDRDGKKSRKARSDFNISKQRLQAGDNADSGCPSSSSSCDRTESRSMFRERFIIRAADQSQSHRSSREQVLRWNEPSKFERRMHESRVIDRSVSRNRYNQGNSSNFSNNFEQNDRNCNDRGRVDRNASYQNMNNSMLPDSFHHQAPRFKRQYLKNMGMSREEIEKFLDNLNSSSNNLDNRYSQSLPTTSNRKSFFIANRNKPHQYYKPHESKVPEVPQSREKSPVQSISTLSVPPIRVEKEVQPNNNEASASGDTSCADNDSSSDEKDSFNDGNFDWAAEVERERENEKKNHDESERLKKEADDKRHDEEKQQSRSTEFTDPQRSRNVSESDSINSNTADSEGYLSWRRQKAISPNRTGFGIRARGLRQDNKGDNRKPFAAKIDNRMNSRCNNLPTVNRSRNTSAGNQQHFPSRSREPIIVFNQSATSSNVPSSSQETSRFNPFAVEQAFVPVFLNPGMPVPMPPTYMNEQYMKSRPAWYDTSSESFRSSRKAPLLLEISRADLELQGLLLAGPIPVWEKITRIRNFLMDALKILLSSDLEFCEAENVEQHMWNIQFYNIINLLNKCIAEDAKNSHYYKSMLLTVIEYGTGYFRSLINTLEHLYEIRIEDYLHVNSSVIKPSDKRFERSALMSAQKIFVCLGDLAKYKEDLKMNSNYDEARQWYLKAIQLNPRSGKPYFHLAILAETERLIFDAVYFYMRSLIAYSNVFNAGEYMLRLFEENQKRYEQMEKNEIGAKGQEDAVNESVLKMEIWIRPNGSRTQKMYDTVDECYKDNSSPTKLYERFILGFLQVHGKLFSQIGSETFSETVMTMLKDFRQLLNFSPLPISTTHLIQMFALNMFAIDTVHLKVAQLKQCYPGLQESVMVISLQIFSLVINRCNQLLKKQLRVEKKTDHTNPNYAFIVDADVQILLPAIKFWCDWLYGHDTKWNPPPSCQKYEISGCGDCWGSLAVLINILQELDYETVLKKNGFHKNILLTSNEISGVVNIDVEEDIISQGFGPLMYTPQSVSYTFDDVPMTLARVCLRIQKILFFGTIFLCGVDPPVLKLQKTNSNKSEYISVVQEIRTFDKQDKDDSVDMKSAVSHGNKELEHVHQKREKYISNKKTTYSETTEGAGIEILVEPQYIIPDVDCLIYRLTEIRKIAGVVSSTSQKPFYSIMIPSIVLNELEKIARGVHKDKTVSDKARFAVDFLRSQKSFSNYKCINEEGTVMPCVRCNLKSYNTVGVFNNGIINICLRLCKQSSLTQDLPDQPKKIHREIVLLTENRDLRMEAEFNNIPVKEISDFIVWAELN